MVNNAPWSFAARTAHAVCTVLYAVYLYLHMALFWPFVVLLGPTWRLVCRMYGTSSHSSADPAPDPSAILALGSPRSFMGDDSLELNNKVCEIIASQIARGDQLGVCVAAYHRGQLVCSCGGGVMRPIDGSGTWQPVEEDTLFLCNSLTKGMAATAFMTLVDEGVVNLDAPVTSVWPEFAVKSNTLSPSKAKMTIADAISHRAGLVDLGPSGIWACICSVWAWCRTGFWRAAWDPMVRRIEALEPEWSPGKHAAYHPVTYSWIVGGIVEGATRRAWGTGVHISDLVKSRVAARIGEVHNMYIGIVPPHEDARIAAMETPRSSAYLNFGRTRGAAEDTTASAPGSLQRWLELFVLAPVEAGLLKLVCNLPLFRRICLPSSNGIVTAKAAAKMYSCLANKGVDPEGKQFVSNATIEMYRARMSEGTDDRVTWPPSRLGRVTSQHPDGAYPYMPARLSLGYFPWYDAELHGKAAEGSFNHAGMGGFAAYACPASGLSLCVMKTVYEPLVAIGGSISPDVCEIAAVVRGELGLR